jgi:hypothetical protein
MSPEVLVEAMRLGCGGPYAGRSPHDLGRFGMGLKTASLAHCRRLSVVSKKMDNKTARFLTNDLTEQLITLRSAG